MNALFLTLGDDAVEESSHLGGCVLARAFQGAVVDEFLALDVADADLGIVSGHEPRRHTVTQGKQHLALVPGFVDVAFTDTVAPNHFLVDGFLVGFQPGGELLNERPCVAVGAKPA